MTVSRNLSPAASAIKRKTYDRILLAVPTDAEVTPREAWRRAGSIGAPDHIRHVLRGLEITIHPRQRDGDSIGSRHPTIEQAIEVFRRGRQ